MKEIKDCSGKDGKYNFHEQCLSCCRCHGAVGNEELMTLEDGNLICSRCNGAQTKLKMYPVFIKSSGKLSVNENVAFTFHLNGMSEISRLFGSGCMSLTTKPGPPQPKNCTKCKMTIEEKSLRFNSKHYHPECFVCGQCGQPLSGREIYRHINGNFCESCWGGARGF